MFSMSPGALTEGHGRPDCTIKPGGGPYHHDSYQARMTNVPKVASRLLPGGGTLPQPVLLGLLGLGPVLVHQLEQLGGWRGRGATKDMAIVEIYK